MATSRPFNKYTLRIFGTLINNVGARLHCYQDGDNTGRIDFYPDGVYMPADYLIHSNAKRVTILLNMPMSRLEAVMATVRLEEPLRLWINIDPVGPGPTTKAVGAYGMLYTGPEPVGEEETP